mgnify:CR=1 FL=1
MNLPKKKSHLFNLLSYFLIFYKIASLYDKSKVKLDASSFVNLNRLDQNQEWNFIIFKTIDDFYFSTPGIDNSKEKNGNNWSIAKFQLGMKRNYKFYLNLFIWPIIFILFVGSGLFVLPPSCIERVTMGALLMLSLVIMFMMLESYTPRSSSNINSVLTQLIVFSLFMISLSTFASTTIMSIDKNAIVYRAVPMWLKDFMLNYLAKLVCKYNLLKVAFSSTHIK